MSEVVKNAVHGSGYCAGRLSLMGFNVLKSVALLLSITGFIIGVCDNNGAYIISASLLWTGAVIGSAVKER